jgi:hypothetical protein
MTLAEDILSLVTRKPGLTEAEIAKYLFGRLGYQQRVNSTCRRLIREHRIERRGMVAQDTLLAIITKRSWTVPNLEKRADERGSKLRGVQSHFVQR